MNKKEFKVCIKNLKYFTILTLPEKEKMTKQYLKAQI